MAYSFCAFLQEVSAVQIYMIYDVYNGTVIDQFYGNYTETLCQMVF